MSSDDKRMLVAFGLLLMMTYTFVSTAQNMSPKPVRVIQDIHLPLQKRA